MKTCQESTQIKVVNFMYCRAFGTSHNVYVSTGKTAFLKERPKPKDRGWAQDYKHGGRRKKVCKRGNVFL